MTCRLDPWGLLSEWLLLLLLFVVVVKYKSVVCWLNEYIHLQWVLVATSESVGLFPCFVHSFVLEFFPHDDTISLRTPSEHCLQCHENTTVVIRTVRWKYYKEWMNAFELEQAVLSSTLHVSFTSCTHTHTHTIKKGGNWWNIRMLLWLLASAFLQWRPLQTLIYPDVPFESVLAVWT